MHYTVDIEIDLPRSRVVELFEDPEFAHEWMEGLVAIRPTEGSPGQEGSKAEIEFQMGKRNVKMTETIIHRNLPDTFVTTYELPGVYNQVRSQFIELDDQKTKWISENEFQFRGMMRVIGWFMKSVFPKQSMKYLEDFKRAAEAKYGPTSS